MTMRYLECECGYTISNEGDQGIGTFKAHEASCNIHKQKVKDEMDKGEKYMNEGMMYTYDKDSSYDPDGGFN